MSDPTDLEITRLCAKAMDLQTDGVAPTGTGHGLWALHDGNRQHYVYNPLHDDAQCFALVKRFKLSCGWDYEGLALCETKHANTYIVQRDGKDLNRTICLCVARMELAKANV